ncbi:MAG: hypothetical protein LBK06_10835 [Planctomycetaceae bacterium]|nr:hypothetical protein [Planctomycetaceae bacterium]
MKRLLEGEAYCPTGYSIKRFRILNQFHCTSTPRLYFAYRLQYINAPK